MRLVDGSDDDAELEEDRESDVHVVGTEETGVFVVFGE